MVHGRHILLTCVLLGSVGGAVFLAVWPIRESVYLLRQWGGWRRAYRRAESNLDVAALSLAHAALLSALLAAAAPRDTRLGPERIKRRFKWLRLGLAAASWSVCLLLLAKALVVALEASDRLWPHGKAAVGLVYM